jgi:tetratricopeptide (TPR) repeat protein
MLIKRGFAVAAPDGDDGRAIHLRLIARRMSSAVQANLGRQLSAEAFAWHEAPIEEAMRHIAADRKDAALDAYRVALARNPRDWQLLGCVAEFVGLQLKEFAAGLELIQNALTLNPWFSPWLWNVLGDCLFCLQRFDEAHEAYRRAEAIDPDDVRTNFNLSYTYFQAGDHETALICIARGLANDRAASFRDRLPDKQKQILQGIATRELGEHEAQTKMAAVLSSIANASSLD